MIHKWSLENVQSSILNWSGLRLYMTLKLLSLEIAIISELIYYNIIITLLKVYVLIHFKFWIYKSAHVTVLIKKCKTTF